MRAVTVADQRLQFSESYPDPEPGLGQVLIRVHAAGLNGADLLQVIFERRLEDVDSVSTPGIARRRETNSAAMALTLKRDAHTTSASARLDSSDQYGENFTGGLAYGYRVSPALRLNASAGTSFHIRGSLAPSMWAWRMARRMIRRST